MDTNETTTPPMPLGEALRTIIDDALTRYGHAATTAPTRQIELLAAPGAAACTLTIMPEVRPDATGQLQIHLPGPAGARGPNDEADYDEHYPVREAVYLRRHKLVLLATDEQAILMPAAAYDRGLPKPSPAESRRSEVLTHCEDLIDGIYGYVDDAAMSETGRLLWDAGGELRGEQLSARLKPRTGLGHLITLDALLAASDTLQHAVLALREALIDAAPELETFR